MLEPEPAFALRRQLGTAPRDVPLEDVEAEVVAFEPRPAKQRVGHAPVATADIDHGGRWSHVAEPFQVVGDLVADRQKPVFRCVHEAQLGRGNGNRGHESER